MHQDIRNKVFLGNSKEVLKTIPSNSVDLVCTSPPYFNLRNYKHDEQIGSEEKAEEYISNLWVIFAECKRIIKPTGAIWVNIADTYGNNKGLMGIPEDFVSMMVKTLGLIRRNTIIWHKPSCMPSSTKDRFTVDFEYFYFFTKEQNYFFNTQYEPFSESTLKEIERAYKGKAKKNYADNGVQDPSEVKRRIIERFEKINFGGNKYPNNQDAVQNPRYSGKGWKIKLNHTRNENNKTSQLSDITQNSFHKQNDYTMDFEGRIKRCVWSLTTANSTEHHFATYPESLIETPIKACTDTDKHSLVLDPFAGSGTTLIKARKMGRSYIGIEINPDYYKIINRRLNGMLEAFC